MWWKSTLIDNKCGSVKCFVQLMLRSVAGKNRFSDVIAWAFSENNRNKFVPHTLLFMQITRCCLVLRFKVTDRGKRNFNMAAILIWNKMFSAFLIGYYEFYVLLSRHLTLNSSGIISKTAGCLSIERWLKAYFFVGHSELFEFMLCCHCRAIEKLSTRHSI